jgi:hypothetical protein
LRWSLEIEMEPHTQKQADADEYWSICRTQMPAYAPGEMGDEVQSVRRPSAVGIGTSGSWSAYAGGAAKTRTSAKTP